MNGTRKITANTMVKMPVSILISFLIVVSTGAAAWALADSNIKINSQKINTMQKKVDSINDRLISIETYSKIIIKKLDKMENGND